METAKEPSSQLSRLVGGLLVIGGLLTVGLIIVAFVESGVRAATDSPSQSGSGPGIPADTLITGTVSDERGPVSGTRVQVSVWPADEEDIQVGEAVDLFQAETVRTDDQGRYVVPLPLEDLPAEYLMRGRVVNFDVTLPDVRVVPVSIPARYSTASGWWTHSTDEAHTDPVSLDFDLEAMVATERSDGDRQKWPLVAW